MLQNVLTQNLDITEFLESRDFELRYIGGKTGYLTDCPFCHKEEHFGVNTDTHRFGCFKCRKAGDYFTLVQKITGKTFSETIEFLKSGIDDRYFNIGFIDDLIKDLNSIKAPEIKPCKLPVEYIPLTAEIEYTQKRKIPLEQIHYYKLGICAEGHYKNRLIVCDVNENQEPIYWIARDISGLAIKKDKVWNPSSEYTALGSADILFNYSLAKNYSCAIITEGVFDSLWVGNNGVASYGKGLKQSHLHWLIQGGFEEVVLLYDSDVKYEELEKDGILLSQYFNTRVCQLPKGDPDDYSKADLAKLIAECGEFKPSRLNTLMGDIE